MSANWDIYDHQVFNKSASLFSDAIGDALKELLEKKHLYQKVAVQWPSAEAVYAKNEEKHNNPETLAPYFAHFTKTVQRFPWLIKNPVSPQGYSETPSGAPVKYSTARVIDIKAPTIKIYCEECEEVNPFNIERAVLVLEQPENIVRDATQQIFFLTYRCQGCKYFLVVFLLKRDAIKIWLSGRVPMEKVLVPKYIPKDVSKHYSSALIAFNSGQVLPAKFMFRVFLEQYVRSAAPNPKSRDIEDLFTAYKKSLSEIFNQQAPSLESIYDELSDHIHAADESPELVNQVRKDIDLHFEAKDLFARFPKK